jgi:hypothetical protein
MPRKTFTAGEVLAAADVNSFLMDQAVQTFTDSTARESAVSTATAPAGLVTYLEDEDAFEYWNGTAYEPFGGAAAADTVEFLVIAGGGGGGGELGGGGGAGGYRNSVAGETSGGTATTEFPTPLVLGTNYFVQIGAGGAGGTSGLGFVGLNGTDSVFETITSSGGGGGGRGLEVPGKIGGSGGASSSRATLSNVTGGLGLFRQGFKGGDAVGAGSLQNAGGGGGAGALGVGGTTTAAGNGGAGLASSITGSSVTRAGGGGGGRGDNSQTNSSGGAGGGGAGGNPGVNGTANTGGGGGGGQGNNITSANGGSGGSGVVILKYPDTFTITIGAGLTGTTDTLSVPDFRITTITTGTGNVSWAAA